eukprot:6392840-Pyramimonas_sp.AAC.1
MQSSQGPLGAHLELRALLEPCEGPLGTPRKGQEVRRAAQRGPQEGPREPQQGPKKSHSG